MNASEIWSFLRRSRETTLVIFFIAFAVIVAAFEPRFLSVKNLSDIVGAAAIVALVAAGVTVVVISGGIDISVGAIVAVSGVVCGSFLENGQVVLGLLAGVGTGLLLGAINAALTVSLRIPSIVVTLATLMVFRGLLAQRTSTTVTNFEKNWFTELGVQKVGSIPVITIISAAIVVLLAGFMSYTQTGRRLYALGGNPEGAVLAGVNAHRLIAFAFCLSGLLAGVAACLFASKFGAVDNSSGSGFEFLAIAAMVLGGTDLFGGEGRIVGTVIGVVVIYGIFNGMVLTGVPGTWQNAVAGATIILAVIADGVRQRRAPEILIDRTAVPDAAAPAVAGSPT